MRRRSPLVYLFAALVIVSCAPIWGVRYHPLPDLANHMAASSVWVHLRDPRWDFAQYYALNLGLNPYWGYYVPMRLMAPIVGIDLANRLVLSLYVLSLPLGVTWLAVRLGRSAWLGLFAFPFLWTFCFTFGFIHTSLGLALVPGAVAAIALGLAVFFCHVVPFLLYIGCAGLVGLLHRERTPRRMLARVGVWAA